MAGDLEDFLKRAAARRQAKAGQDAAQKRAARPVSQPKPEYTDARRERQVRPPAIDDEPLMAEVVEQVDPLAEKRAQVLKSQNEAAAASARSAKETADIHKVRDTDSGAGSADSVRLRNDLLAALRNPRGIRQAILLSEIMTRPADDRWD